MKPNPIFEMEKIKALRAAGGNNHILLYLAVYGLDGIPQIFGSIDEFKICLRSTYHRNQVQKVLKRIFEAKKILERNAGASEPYTELVEKFIDGFNE